jgi:uncharacterized protein (DUF1499 family)
VSGNGKSDESSFGKRRAIWLLIGLAAGAALLTPRRWLTTNDITTGGTPQYPDLEPRHFDRDPREVFEAVRHAVRHMARWKVVREDEHALKVDAEVRTYLLPFTDDVSVWIEPDRRGCRVMIRSHSRVGRGDFGENARTIRALQRVIDEEIRALDRPGRVGRPDPGVGVLTADDGSGPLLQRDYEGIIVGSSWTPERVLKMVREDIERFSAAEMAKFVRPPRDRHALQVGDDIEVHITGAGETHVRVAHVDGRSLTLRTMDDHLEAGRITFGSWRDEEGRLVFHIRSRARQAGPVWLLGFVVGGKKLQTRIWETFVERVAEAAGGRLEDGVEVRTQEVSDSLADVGGLDTPTMAVPAES